MNLIDRTYFIGEINIANTEKTYVQERIDLFITKYQAELLENILGIELYDAFMAGLLVDPLADKWKDLRDGKSYTDLYGVRRKWVGFANTEKRSPIANYVYYRYKRDDSSITLSMGEAIPKAENATTTDSATKQARAWNEMVDWIILMDNFLGTYPDTYPEYTNAIMPVNFIRYINSFNI